MTYYKFCIVFYSVDREFITTKRCFNNTLHKLTSNKLSELYEVQKVYILPTSKEIIIVKSGVDIKRIMCGFD